MRSFKSAGKKGPMSKMDKLIDEYSTVQKMNDKNMVNTKQLEDMILDL